MKVFNLIVILFMLTACDSKSDKPNVELIQNMMESPAIKAQDHDPKRPSERAMRLPPENAIAIGKPPYPYSAKPEEAGRELKNPYAGQTDVLTRGKVLYNTYCMVCHGPKGLGNGTVADKMLVKPPTFASAKVRNWPDGRLYHIIADGQGLMSSYASQIQPDDRWKIVEYMRQLQKETKE